MLPTDFVLHSRVAHSIPSRPATVPDRDPGPVPALPEPVRIVRASHLGMCFGVRGAIAKVLRIAHRERVTVLGELVHNRAVLDRLAASGVLFQREAEAVETPVVAITAHGASRRRLAEVRGLGLKVVDATCPLVRTAHHAVSQFVEEGFHPVIVGVREHVEVRGLTEDLDAYDVVASEADIERLVPRPRFGVAAQTTQPVERVQHLAAVLQARFPESEVRLADTVCLPTRLRQEAAVALSTECDVVIVVGGANSNNTRELCETCRRYCERVFQVQGPDDLRREWLDGVRVAGLTAGTSTPDDVIDAVEARLREMAGGEERSC